MAEIKFEITKHIGVLSPSSKGWTKELNLIPGMIETAGTEYKER